jgi:hypothetical protein
MIAAWANFYVIVGSAAAALISVQFVVIALIANLRTLTNSDLIRAFGTPTVVHLGSALVVSAVMTAPWPSPLAAGMAIGTCGLVGVAYGCLVIRRARRQTTYQPVWEDWLWHALLPCGVYAAFALAGLLLYRAPTAALFVVASGTLVLLLIGIHNAWDTVTYIVTSAPHRESKTTN